LVVVNYGGIDCLAEKEFQTLPCIFVSITIDSTGDFRNTVNPIVMGVVLGGGVLVVVVLSSIPTLPFAFFCVTN
jgi:hypothetical protein